MLVLNGKGFVFNGGTNESYLVEYQRRKDCPSHYTFIKYETLNKNFSETTVNDVINFGKDYFRDENFTLEFNNEIIYELIDEEKNEKIQHFANLNLLTQRDIKRGDQLYKINSFHSIGSNSELFSSFRNKILMELKIPVNDILTLRKEKEEVHIEFINDDIFKNS